MAILLNMSLSVKFLASCKHPGIKNLLVTGLRRLNDTRTSSDVDYFGISDATTKDVAGCSDLKYNFEEIKEKYKFLTEENYLKEQKEKTYITSFGQVRLDRDNRVKSHGQFEKINKQQQSNTKKFVVDYNSLNEMSEDSEQQKEEAKAPEIKFEDFGKDDEEDEFEKNPQEKTGLEYLKDIKEGKTEPVFAKGFKDKLSQNVSVAAKKLDSKGFRILKDQVPDYHKCTNEDILQMLIESILFNDTDILVINKPYGITCHGSDETATSPLLTKFLPKLSEHVECEKLYTVHRLDKETTGILILAKTQEKAKFLNELFLESKILKEYWCITKNVPDPKEGIIDIPIDVGIIDGKERMVLRPELLEDARRLKNRYLKNAKRAVTYYKVLDESDNAALVEVRPETGVKHQIRVHLGFGLRCPILGDHKYSYLDKLVPQKLPNDILNHLKVRQAKVRHVPMHLHSRQCYIPEAGHDRRNVLVNAPLPLHFVKNMKSLKLRKK